MNDMLKVLNNWGLGDVVIAPIESPSETTWDVDGKYILKRYRSADDLSRSIQFSSLLLQEEVSVAAYIPTISGQLSFDSYCLMTKLEGNHVNIYEEPYLAQIMGRELAQLHIALSHIEPKITCHDCNFLSDFHKLFKPSITGLVEDEMIDDRRH